MHAVTREFSTYLRRSPLPRTFYTLVNSGSHASLKNPKNCSDNTYGPRYAPQNLPLLRVLVASAADLLRWRYECCRAELRHDTAGARSADRRRSAHASASPGGSRLDRAIQSPADVGRAWTDVDDLRLKVEAGSWMTLDDTELTAAVAHELGHVWIFTHHPSCRPSSWPTKSRCGWGSPADVLAQLYDKVWKRAGFKGDLDRFLGTEVARGLASPGSISGSAPEPLPDATPDVPPASAPYVRGRLRHESSRAQLCGAPDDQIIQSAARFSSAAHSSTRRHLLALNSKSSRSGGAPLTSSGGSLQTLPDGTLIMQQRSRCARSSSRRLRCRRARSRDIPRGWTANATTSPQSRRRARRQPARAGAMMRRVFEDRMKLKGHVEERERTVFALVLARSDGRLGPQLKPSALDLLPRQCRHGRRRRRRRNRRKPGAAADSVRSGAHRVGGHHDGSTGAVAQRTAGRASDRPDWPPGLLRAHRALRDAARAWAEPPPDDVPEAISGHPGTAADCSSSPRR